MGLRSPLGPESRSKALRAKQEIELNSLHLSRGESPRMDLDNEMQISRAGWIIKKAREFQKNNYFCFIDYTKAFRCVDHNKPVENS